MTNMVITKMLISHMSYHKIFEIFTISKFNGILLSCNVAKEVLAASNCWYINM